MLEIVVDAHRTQSLRLAVIEATEAGDYDGLYDDVRDCFSEEQVDLIEDMLDSGDITEAIDEIVEEWSAEDVDELFESIEAYLAESAIEITFLQDEFAEEDDEEFAYDDEDDFVDGDDASEDLGDEL
jgi:hypothetical protein